MIADKIEAYLRGKSLKERPDVLEQMTSAFSYAVARQFMDNREVKSRLGGSNSGPCARKMAYDFLAYTPSKDLDARAKITFLTGDFIELAAVGLMKLAGIPVRNTILDPDGQEEGYFDVGNGVMVPCHADGILLPYPGAPFDTEGLLEVKSVADATFKREVLKDRIGDSYKLQHNVYLDAFGKNWGVFLYINKNTGHMHEILTAKDPYYVEWARLNHTMSTSSSPDNLPPRFEDGENYGRRTDKAGNPTNRLAWGCGYCSYNLHCWPEITVKIESGRPVHYISEDFDDGQFITKPSFGEVDSDELFPEF